MPPVLLFQPVRNTGTPRARCRSLLGLLLEEIAPQAGERFLSAFSFGEELRRQRGGAGRAVPWRDGGAEVRVGSAGAGEAGLFTLFLDDIVSITIFVHR